jgi:hypothetical protein
MRSSVRAGGWRLAAAAAFAATAALAVTSSRGTSLDAALAAAPRASAGHAAPRCAAGSLRIRLRGAAAAAAYAVEFTNVSAAACTLRGYPAVTAYGPHRMPVGNPADRDGAAARPVVLAPGASAHAAVDAGVAAYSAHTCRPVTAAGLRVTPPGAATEWYLRQLLTACSASGHHAPVFLHVLAVQAGPGGAPAR